MVVNTGRHLRPRQNCLDLHLSLKFTEINGVYDGLTSIYSYILILIKRRHCGVLAETTIFAVIDISLCNTALAKVLPVTEANKLSCVLMYPMKNGILEIPSSHATSSLRAYPCTIQLSVFLPAIKVFILFALNVFNFAEINTMNVT